MNTSIANIVSEIDDLMSKKRSMNDSENDEPTKYYELDNNIQELENIKYQLEVKMMNIRVKQYIFKKLIDKLKQRHGDNEQIWHSDVLDQIKNYIKHDFSFPNKNRASGSVKLNELPDDGYFDGGKPKSKLKHHKFKPKSKRTKKNKRSTIICARCCTRRSRRISCRKGETALRR